MSKLNLESIVKLQVPELRSESKGTKADLLVQLLSAVNDMKLDEVIMPDSAVDVAPNLGTKAAINITINETTEEQPTQTSIADEDGQHEVIDVESSQTEEKSKQIQDNSQMEARLKAGLHEIEQKLFYELARLRSEFAISDYTSHPTRQALIAEADRLRKENVVLEQRLRYVETEFKNLREETRVLSEEKRNLVTALRLVSNDSEETQAISSRVITDQTTSSQHAVHNELKKISKEVKTPKKKKKGKNQEHREHILF